MAEALLQAQSQGCAPLLTTELPLFYGVIMPNFCASVLFVDIVLLKPLAASGLFPSLGRGEPLGGQISF